MEPKQLEDENHLLHSTNNSIAGFSDPVNQQDWKESEVHQSSFRRRWIVIGVAILLVIITMVVISLMNYQFGSVIGYYVLFPTLASTLACLLGVSLVEIINTPTRRKK
jgi:hypothetical protein